ncbi:MAG: nuclear transport factor 2 family protein [Patescibacteria group bacterium]
MIKKQSKNIETVYAILKDEIRGDIKSAIKKMAGDYSMTWMYQTKKGELFPATGKDIKTQMKEAYPIKGREYNIKNIAEGKNVVIVELIESYPDPKTKKVYRTPLVLVLEMRDGKIKTGRHYCDPKISYLNLSEKKIRTAFK